MKFICALVIISVLATVDTGLASIVALPAAAVVRAPQYDSAVVHSDRFGGNFAYSVSEGHAYQTLTPIVSPIVSYQWPGIPVASLPPQVFIQQPWFGTYPVVVPGVSGVPGAPGAPAPPGVPDIVDVDNTKPETGDNGNREPLGNDDDDDNSVSIESAK